MKFEEVKTFLSGIGNINRGGCGISALSMYRWLKKNDKAKVYKFVYAYRSDDKDEYLNNKNILKGGNGTPKSCCHCFLKKGNKCFDCVESINIENYKWIQIIEEEEFIKNSINNVSCWNSLFNRENIKIIEEKLNIDLSDIKN
jgi:hypothetical protein